MTGFCFPDEVSIFVALSLVIVVDRVVWTESVEIGFPAQFGC